MCETETGETNDDDDRQTHWGGVLDMVMPKRLSPLRREACQLLRVFIFGKSGLEDKKGVKEKEKVFTQPKGPKEEVEKLFQWWDQVDSEKTGSVDLNDLRT